MNKGWRNMNKGLRITLLTVIGISAVVLITFGTMALWNWLVPDLFNGPRINFWQTLGLLVLTKIFGLLLSGKRGHHGPSGYWKYRMYEKFSNMTPEQREQFKQRMKEKWCYRPENAPNKDSAPSNV